MVFDYGVNNCTQVMAQIKIDQKSGTTQDGSLRYQEDEPAAQGDGPLVVAVGIHPSDGAGIASPVHGFQFRYDLPGEEGGRAADGRRRVQRARQRQGAEIMNLDCCYPELWQEEISIVAI